MAGGERKITAPSSQKYIYGSPIPPLCFWGAIMAMGILLIYSLPKANYSVIVAVIGCVLITMGAVFIAGILYFNIDRKKDDYDDVSDLV
jgi:hypothetical protein